jgi:DNA-binding XRE family transcriptional regulator
MQRTPTAELSQLILQCRTERNLSLSEMAKQVHLSATGLSKIERKKVKPNRTTEGRLVAFLRKHGYFPKQEVEVA